MGQPPPDGDKDRGPGLIIIYWVMSAIASLIVVLRIIARTTKTPQRQFGLDDFLMVLTLLLLLALSGTVTAMALVGGCRHLYYLTPIQASKAVKLNYISQAIAVPGFATAKFSIAWLILRIMGKHSFWRRWVLYIAIAGSIIFSVINVILTFVQCEPSKALWHPELVASGRATCWSHSVQLNFAFFLGAWNVVIDTLLAVLPATLIWKLQISFRRKISCAILLGLGILAAITAAIKIRYLASLARTSDITWATYELLAWSGAEIFVLIVCGSVAPIKPLYDLIFRSYRNSTSRRHESNSRAYEKATAKTPPLGTLTSSSSGRNLFDDEAAENVELATPPKTRGSSKTTVTGEVQFEHTPR